MAEFPQSPDSLDDPAPVRPKKPGNGPLLAMVVLGLLLVGGLAFALYYFLSDRGSLDSEMLAYLPADTTVVLGADIEELMKNGKAKDIFGKYAGPADNRDPYKEFNEQLKEAGLTVNDFSKALVGMDPKSGSGKPTLVFRTKKSFDKQKLATAMHFKNEQKKGDKTYFTDASKDHIFFPTDTLVVIAPEKHFETLFNKEPSKVLVGDEMQGLCKKMAKGQYWAAATRAALPDDFNATLDEAKKGRVPYAPPALLELAKDAKAAGFYMKLDGDRVKVVVAVVGASKEKAEAAEKEMKAEVKDRRDKKLEDDALIGKEFGKAPEDVRKFVVDVQKSIDVDRDGNTLEVTVELNLKAMETALKGLEDWKSEQRRVGVMEIEVQDKQAMDRQIKAMQEQMKLERLVPKSVPSEVPFELIPKFDLKVDGLDFPVEGKLDPLPRKK